MFCKDETDVESRIINHYGLFPFRFPLSRLIVVLGVFSGGSSHFCTVPGVIYGFPFFSYLFGSSIYEVREDYLHRTIPFLRTIFAHTSPFSHHGLGKLLTSFSLLYTTYYSFAASWSMCCLVHGVLSL